mmetsp:Transcript_33931/g.95467  ORF Transcript_33931/g.95467 Transcript_33931/m.95467 type:complete len:206 (-) Transcript_33931:232-849(-)
MRNSGKGMSEVRPCGHKVAVVHRKVPKGLDGLEWESEGMAGNGGPGIPDAERGLEGRVLQGDGGPALYEALRSAPRAPSHGGVVKAQPQLLPCPPIGRQHLHSHVHALPALLERLPRHVQGTPVLPRRVPLDEGGKGERIVGVLVEHGGHGGAELVPIALLLVRIRGGTLRDDRREAGKAVAGVGLRPFRHALPLPLPRHRCEPG